MRSFKNHISGFSLVSASVAVMIAGIILAATLIGGHLTSDAQKNTLTRHRMQKIEKAMQSFMAANHRLPCPADGELAIPHRDFGVAGRTVNVLGDTTDGSANIAIDDITQYSLRLGMRVSGAGIPDHAIISDVRSSPSRIDIDPVATATASDVSITITSDCSTRSSTGEVVKPASDFTNALLLTGDTTTGSAQITSVSGNISSVLVGTSVTGAGIPAGARVIRIDNATQFTLDVIATADNIGATLLFGSVVAGTVPTKTLGLPDEYAFDGHGNLFAYVVDSLATQTSTCHDLQSTDTAGGLQILPSAPAVSTGDTTNASNTLSGLSSMTTNGADRNYSVFGPGIAEGTYIGAIVNDSTVALSREAMASITGGTYTIVPPATDTAMWAIVSYGKDAHGAYTAAPVTGSFDRIKTGNTNFDTLNNAFVNAAFVTSFSGMLVQHEPVTTTSAGAPFLCTAVTCRFDDIVWTPAATKNTCCLGRACEFATTVKLDDANYKVNGMASGDLNGDGIPDIAVTVNDGSAQTTYVLFGKKKGWPGPLKLFDAASLDGSNGGFIITHGGTSAIHAGNIAIGDVSGDGFGDLVIPHNTGSFALLFGRQDIGGGNITVTDAYLTGAETTGTRLTHSATNDQTVAVADVDGDGTKDIVYTGSVGSAYVVFGRAMADWTAGGGAAAADVTIEPGTATLTGYGLAVGDVNADGAADIALQGTASSNGTPYVIFGRPQGGGANQWPASPGTLTFSTELLTASKAIALDTADYNPGSAANATIADIDGDGNKDLLIPSTSGVKVYYGVAGSGWSPVVAQNNDTITSMGSWPVQVADVNNDGNADAIATTLTGATGDSVKAYFQSTTNDFGSGNWDDIAWAAYDPATGDGYVEIRNDGTSPYDPDPPVLYYPIVTDFNADGRNDILIAATGTDSGGTPIRIHGIYGRYRLPWEAIVDLQTLP